MKLEKNTELTKNLKQKQNLKTQNKNPDPPQKTDWETILMKFQCFSYT